MLRFNFPIFCALAPASATSTQIINHKSVSKSNDHHALRSKAGLKLIEIDEKISIFGKLERFEKQKLKHDSSPRPTKANEPKFINMYSAVDFGASPGGFAQVLSKNLTRRINGNVNIPHAVITVDNREIQPKIRNTVHLRGGIEEHNTLKRVKATIDDCTRKYLGDANLKEDDHDEFVVSPQSGAFNLDLYNLGEKKVVPMEIKHRVVIVTNDTVAILKGRENTRSGKDDDDDQGAFSHHIKGNRKYSVTYAQNNLVCCAMRRSLDLLECFQKHSLMSGKQTANRVNNNKPKGLGVAVQVEEREGDRHGEKVPLIETYCPPCFFISKILRSVHVNRVMEMAEKYFDSVRLLELKSSSSQLERYLVAETRGTKVARKPFLYRHLSLPPAPGETAEWFCWGCLNKRPGDCFACPVCSSRK